MKRAAAWLGLVTDDRYADYDERDDQELTEGISREELVGHGSSALPSHGTTSAYGSSGQHGSATNRSAPGRGTGSGQPVPSGQGSSSPAASVTPLETRRPGTSAASNTSPSISRAADMSRIVTVHPRTYNEARTIGEHFRDGVPVIMNLSEMEDVDAKRLVDFAAGLIFGLRGTIERVTSKVFLLSPQNVNVTAEDKERIAGGFFNQS
jgi:cell division inhibitor SepF